MKHSTDPQLLERPIRILVVGCGGNGSAIAAGLPYLHQALLAFGHPGGLTVTLIDPDTVSETNCVRQPFCRTEIGLSKADCPGASDEHVLGTQLAGHAVKDRTAEERYSGRHPHRVRGHPESPTLRSTAGLCAPEYCTGLISATTHPAGSSSSGSRNNPANRKKKDRLQTVAELYPLCFAHHNGYYVALNFMWCRARFSSRRAGQAHKLHHINMLERAEEAHC